MAKDNDSMQPRPAPAGSVPLPTSKRGFKAFWVEVGRELKRVSWPSRGETNRLTGVVLSVTALIMITLILMHTLIHSLITLITTGKVSL